MLSNVSHSLRDCLGKYCTKYWPVNKAAFALRRNACGNAWFVLWSEWQVLNRSFGPSSRKWSWACSSPSLVLFSDWRNKMIIFRSSFWNWCSARYWCATSSRLASQSEIQRACAVRWVDLCTGQLWGRGSIDPILCSVVRPFFFFLFLYSWLHPVSISLIVNNTYVGMHAGE